MNPAFPTTGESSPTSRRHKNTAVGAERQLAFGVQQDAESRASATEDVEGLFPFYKQPSDLDNSTTHLKVK